MKKSTRTTLDPKLDVIFKILFAHPEGTDILISLLTAVLQPPRPITSVHIRNPEIPKAAALDKGIILDIRVELEDGSDIDVEMQAERKPGLRRRALYYWARTFSSKIQRGGEYKQLKPLKVIFFMEFREVIGTRFHSVFHVMERESRERWSDVFELHTVELPKLGKMNALELKKEPPLVRWGRFLAATSDEELAEAAKGDDMVTKAKTLLEQLSAEPGVRELAEQRELAFITYRLEMGAAKEEGIIEGEAKGKAESILSLLSIRGIDVSDKAKEKILACQDPDLLNTWFHRAVNANLEHELFS